PCQRHPRDLPSFPTRRSSDLGAMTYQQVRDVVKLLRQSHQQLRDALEQPRSRSADSRTRLMLEGLRSEEQQLQIALARYDAEGQDRKSTRLNSSHVKISYAVF